MSIDAAIQNVGEYFSAHYLAGNDGFSKDIKDQVKRWKNQGSQSAPRKLQALGDAFFAAKSKALDYPEPELRSKSGDKDLDNWHPKLLEALGYHPESVAIELGTEKKQLPGLLRLNRHSQPWLAILQAPFCISSGDLVEEALEEFVEPVSETVEGLPTLITEWERAIALLFKQEDRPRWALLLAGSKVYLFDAHAFAQGRYIYIDLDIAYSVKDKAAFDAIAALLAHDCVAPESESDEVLHEKLREGSVKSTHGVSEQLQGAVREAIELIANGWIEARRQKALGYKQLSDREPALPDGSREVTAELLKHDALVYIYRVLFCLYAEARGGELGVLPITDDIYRLGYSMEALRDLADMGEPGTQSEDGSYYAEHLSRLFQLVHEGFHPEKQAIAKAASIQPAESEQSTWAFSFPEQSDMFGGGSKQLTLDRAIRKQLDKGNAKTFVIQPLTATLFAPQATPLLNLVKLSNLVLHQVIRRLSLGTGKKGKQIGRINYAELGIVQLGSVYEGLLSYKGFFAKENLLQVIQAGKTKTVKGKKETPIVFDDAVDPKKPSWFVSETRLHEFKEGEVVIEKRTHQPRIYRTGEFILHLNGVDRVNSASYYTPEVLTRALVKEALKERLKSIGPEQADDILKLKICEPAMGSAAFLVEAIDQLALQYLLLKQGQLKQTIEPSAFEEELGRVKHYIAVHNVYGVDLNSTAVELGALSLWLSSIHSLKVKAGESGEPDVYRPGQTPWFGLRLRAGNSLIGARRAVWDYDQLASGKHYGKDALAPRQLKPGELRKDDEIYHFLVWDEDMAPAARDTLMRFYWKSYCDAINEWNKKQVKQKWTPEQLAKARDICVRIDELWGEYTKDRVIGLAQTECTATVWPTAASSVEALKHGPSLEFQESLKDNLESQSGAFQRLKLLMDSWCSFYFWPLEHSTELPSRGAWLAAAEVLLGCEAVENESTRAMLDITLGGEIDLEALFTESNQQLPDASKLAASVSWFQIARQVGTSQNFHHWELVFTEILGPNLEINSHIPSGFDLMFGNPPWMKVTWNDSPLLSEFDPLLGVRQAKSADINIERPRLLVDTNRKIQYRNVFQLELGSLIFLNDRALYPALTGVQTNLYKNFIECSWLYLGVSGIAALLHPEGVFDDPKGGLFREEYLPRLLGHYQFKNQLMLFADIGDRKTYSINVYGSSKNNRPIKSIFNIFHPKTIEACFNSDANAVLPAIKDEDNNWDLRGHRDRVIGIDEKLLKLFTKLFEDEGTHYLQTRLPLIHSIQLVRVLEKFANTNIRLSDIRSEYFASTMFDETFAQRDGVITREDNPSFQPKNVDEWVVSGPHIFAANPFYKSSRESCTESAHYDRVDLTVVVENYLPRAVYRPGDEDGNLEKFYAEISEWPKPAKPRENEAGDLVGGFWPVGEKEIVAYEILLGEPLDLYGISPLLPGSATARQFGYFDVWEGDVKGAIESLSSPGSTIRHCDFPDIRIRQIKPRESIKYLPKPQTSYPKYALRAMCQPGDHRTLIGSLMPEGVSSINAIRFVAFNSPHKLICFSSLANSIVADFLIKVKGRNNVHDSDISQLPFLDGKAIELANNRTCRLSCLTCHYSTLWNDLYKNSIVDDSFTKFFTGDRQECSWNKLSAEWRFDYALRSDAARRQASLEVDVLVCIDLGVSSEELIQIYRTQFPVLKSYDEADLYDSKGNRLPNTDRRDSGGKEVREAMKNHDDKTPVTVSWQIDNGNITVTRTFYPPFEYVDRIDDYKTAYRVFSERLGLYVDKEKEQRNCSSIEGNN